MPFRGNSSFWFVFYLRRFKSLFFFKLVVGMKIPEIYHEFLLYPGPYLFHRLSAKFHVSRVIKNLHFTSLIFRWNTQKHIVLCYLHFIKPVGAPLSSDMPCEFVVSRRTSDMWLFGEISGKKNSRLATLKLFNSKRKSSGFFFLTF